MSGKDVARKLLILSRELVLEQKNTSLGRLKGPDVFFEVYTKSYGSSPIIIQGAGAGKEVTARGLLSDIVKVAASDSVIEKQETI